MAVFVFVLYRYLAIAIHFVADGFYWGY